MLRLGLQPADKRRVLENGEIILQLDVCRAARPSACISTHERVDLAQILKILSAIVWGHFNCSVRTSLMRYSVGTPKHC